MVERTEHEHDIDRFVPEIEGAGIAERGIHSLAVSLPHLLDVMRDDVAMHHLVARVDEPVGVAPGTATDVRDHCSRRRKRPLDDLHRAAELHPA